MFLMILTVTLLCDRKASSQLVAVSRLLELDYEDYEIYLNIETEDFDKHFAPLKELLAQTNKTVHMDIWNCKSTWAPKPKFDQDQARLNPIMTARNMSIQAAQGLGATHILQVDADVVIPKDSISRLLKINRAIVGGRVGGRGAHAGIWYGKNASSDLTPNLPPNLVEMEYCTCGFVLIEREVFDLLKYRSGPHNTVKTSMLSEDPAFGTDAHDVWGFDWWTVDTTLVAEHWDDPENPMTADQGAQF